MRTSRTRPTKLATAPTWFPLEMFFTSRPRSKSSRCTEILISAARHRRKERDLVARLDARRGLHHVLVERAAHQLLFRECSVVRSAARSQVSPQGGDGRDLRRKLDVLRVGA